MAFGTYLTKKWSYHSIIFVLLFIIGMKLRVGNKYTGPTYIYIDLFPVSRERDNISHEMLGINIAVAVNHTYAFVYLFSLLA